MLDDLAPTPISIPRPGASAFTSAAVTRAGGAHASHSLGTHLIRVTAAQTSGVASIWEEIVEPGEGPPMHAHHREDEAFHVLEGWIGVWCGPEYFETGPGASFVLPRGVPHRFRNIGGTRARLLIQCTPGGFEGFFLDLDKLRSPGPAEIGAAAARYGLEFV